ncbi:hypothetical protein, partial [Streptomyces sp. NPDC060131]|uniref:hypothetical protein n=1 Tax=Streptomyces sp. NPDC060131 TaxID=3347058 RepID=UPI003648CF17
MRLVQWSRYANRAVSKSSLRTASISRWPRALSAITVTASPLEKSGSMKSLACGSRHHRSPTTFCEANWVRSVETYGRTARARSNCRAT